MEKSKKSRVEKLGKNCEDFGKKFGQLKECGKCRVSKPLGWEKCREQSPKKSDDREHNGNRRSKRKVIARSYETCRGPFKMNCEECPEFQFQDCEGLYFSKKPRWVIDKYSRALTPTEQKILDCLERFASFAKNKDDFGYCFPSHEKIAEATGVSYPNIGKYIKSLERKGLVKQEWKRFKKNGGFVTHHAYCLLYLIRQKELDEKKSNTQ